MIKDITHYDALSVVKDTQLTCLDHGFVRIVDVMPRLVPEGRTADYAIVQAARVSTAQGLKTVEEDENLIRYMMRQRHTSVFEQVQTKWHIRLPIFVARQWIRHRTASVNEQSGRMSVLPSEFYIPRPEDIRSQSTTNKQGSGDRLDDMAADDFVTISTKDNEKAFETYNEWIDKGMAKELSRINLPLSTYTEWYWTQNLHNLFHFLSLRLDKHAQYEIRVYAEAMFTILKQICPVACRAFEDYRLNSLSLSAGEIGAIKSNNYDALSEREKNELYEKMLRLGL